MTEILSTPSKQSCLYRTPKSRLPQTDIANVTLHKAALFPTGIFAYVKHRPVVVLANYHILLGASNCLQVITDVFAVSTACIEQNGIAERPDERVDRFKEFRC